MTLSERCFKIGILSLNEKSQYWNMWELVMELLQIDYFERLVASQTPKKVADVGELFRDNKLAFGPKERRPQSSYKSILEYPRFCAGAATNRHFREVCSSQHPQKISRCIKATFFGRKKIWIHVNPITEQKVTWSPTASVWRGGVPLLES